MRRVLIAILALCGTLCAETSAQRLLEDKLLFDQVKQIAASIHGVLGVATIDLSSGRLFVFNGETEFPAASTIKVPVLVELFHAVGAGRVRLDQQVTLTSADSVGGSGELQTALEKGPVTLTVRELAAAMIRDSDNTAANRCILLAGRDRVNSLLAERGMRATTLRRVMMDTAAAARDDENTTSPVEMARFFEDLYRGRLADPAATREMVGMLETVHAGVRKVVPEAIPVASKPGDLTGVRCETAIVLLPQRPFVVAVYSTFLDDDEDPVPAVARAAFAYFSKLAGSNRYGNRVR